MNNTNRIAPLSPSAHRIAREAIRGSIDLNRLYRDGQFRFIWADQALASDALGGNVAWAALGGSATLPPPVLDSLNRAFEELVYEETCNLL